MTVSSTNHVPAEPTPTRRDGTRYLWDDEPDLGAEHLELLELVLDPYSIGQLERLDLPERARCLEIGAGNGSIARWLAQRPDPAVGSVLATDLDTAYLSPMAGVSVLQHDITDGVPGGPYDLIHARMVLTHLPDRDAVLSRLVDALAPGGWLLLGDSAAPPTLAARPDPADEEAFQRFARMAYEMVAPAAGQALTWAGGTHTLMQDAGLSDIHADRFSFLTRGGDLGCRLHLNLSRQGATHLRKAGLSEEDLDRYQRLLMKPSFRSWFYQLVYTRGRKPQARPSDPVRPRGG
ncbi:class I SAM-dependent methyltransferase [Microlunatus soli]|uniref:Methyltransferase domain-containing protein n=1 Tax=Microlunatus soli TaxID=630515 RepID=A0A1H1V7F8_9ACTN|nr:class I SAM-dependent methyltransferase [Microlunatus soli]SDS80613.1 Methyltransferase domain-containing protein [Microlunatus soli]